MARAVQCSAQTVSGENFRARVSLHTNGNEHHHARIDTIVTPHESMPHVTVHGRGILALPDRVNVASFPKRQSNGKNSQ